MPAYHGMSKVLVCRYILAWAKFQYAGISWHEQGFSMPAYHGMSKVVVCRHIMVWAKFQCASISWQERNFSMPAYHGIDQNPQSPFISVRQHIKASINNSYRRLFRHASISRHSIFLSVIASSGSVIYRDIDLKANKHHISYHIRFRRVSRFSILTCLIIFCILTSAQWWHSPRGISVYRHCQSRQCRWDIAWEAKCRYKAQEAK
jgi:hypothetical protein